MILQASLFLPGLRVFQWRAVWFAKLSPDNFSRPLFHPKALIPVRRLCLFAGDSALCATRVAQRSLFSTGLTWCSTGHL